MFYRNFYEAIRELPKQNQAEIYEAIFNFEFNLEETELKGISKTVFKLIKPQLEPNKNLITLCKTCHELQHMNIVVDFGEDFGFHDFINKENFIKECRKQLRKDTKCIYIDRSTHSDAIEFFDIIEVSNNNIYIKHSGGAS